MGYIHRTLNPGSGINEDTDLIQCVDVREPNIHEIWSLGLDGIISKVHPTAQIEVIAGTIREFVTNYLAENGRRIQIIGKLSINNSVQFLGVTAQAWGRGFPSFSTCRIPLRPHGGEVVTLQIRTGEVACLTLTALQTAHGVLPSTPIWLTCRGFRLTHAPPHAASTTTLFVAGVNIV